MFRSLATLFLVCHQLVAEEANPAPAKRPPNVVILFSDDAGWADFGFQPHPAADIAKMTPHLDKLAAQGAVMTQAYVSGCVCSPSRAGLQTGRYQQRFGHDNNLPPGFQGGLDIKQKTMADRLADLGYDTALIGKWHLGYPEAYHPGKRGYGDFYGLLQGARSYHPLAKPSKDQVITHNGSPLAETGYVTDRFGELACDYIKSNKDTPFFLFVSFTAVHGPLQPRKEDEDFVKGLPVKGGRANYIGLMKALDENVGRITACLKEQGLEEDTLVIFTNDNGGQIHVGADNGPIREGKGTLYEGGTRVPMIFRWPGRIKAGQRLDDQVISLDFIPTLLAAAGQNVEPARENLDGINLLPRLTGSSPSLPGRPLFWRSGGSKGLAAVRLGDWKMVWNRNKNPELYNLKADLGEKNDLAASEAAKLDELKKLFLDWEKGMEEPRWGKSGQDDDSGAGDEDKPKKGRKKGG
ncbi:MAG: Arylsulfatase [Verrucomicrobiota bacterium]